MSQFAVEPFVERLQPLDVLFEAPGRAEFGLPDELAALYHGPFGFSELRLYAPGSMVGCRLLTLRQARSRLLLRYDLPRSGFGAA